MIEGVFWKSSTWRARDSKLRREVVQPLLAPVHLPEIQAGPDLADLIADPAGDERGLGVVEHDAFLAIEPARPLVHLGDDGVESERGEAVLQLALLCIEDLTLPREVVDEGGDPRAVGRARCDDRGALRLAVGDLAGRTAGEERIELRLGHLQKLRHVVRHGHSLLRSRRSVRGPAPHGGHPAPTGSRGQGEGCAARGARCARRRAPGAAHLILGTRKPRLSCQRPERRVSFASGTAPGGGTDPRVSWKPSSIRLACIPSPTGTGSVSLSRDFSERKNRFVPPGSLQGVAHSTVISLPRGSSASPGLTVTALRPTV